MVKYSLIFLGLSVVIACFYVFSLKYTSQKEKLIMSELSQTAKPTMVEWPEKFFKESKVVTAAEIGDISRGELDQELKNGREKIQHENMIERLNKGQASLEEVKQAKILFERLALLSIENAHRMAQELAPEIESGLDKIGQDLEKIKELLGHD